MCVELQPGVCVFSGFFPPQEPKEQQTLSVYISVTELLFTHFLH